MVLISSLFHVAIAVFFRWGARNFTILRNEGRLEFFDLLVIFDNLTFDFRHNTVFTGLGYVLLGDIQIENWLWFLAL